MPLPFASPALSSGYAALRPGSARLGTETATAVTRSVAALLGCEVSISGRPVPGRPGPRAGVGRVGVDLAALPGAAVLEVDAALVVALVDRLAGGPGRAGAATRLTPVESALLDLLALAAIDGACEVPAVEAALAPRLAARTADAPGGALAVELQLAAGAASGRGRLLLPAEAVRALTGDEAGSPGWDQRAGASLRTGSAWLSETELAALAPGDVVVLDGGGGADLVVPGGARFAGRLVEGNFTVEAEVDMDGRKVTIPIALEVELARVEVTLGELARLEPGAVLPLGIDRRGHVALVVGGRTLARGELVDVEGAVGVRILELLP